MQYKKLSLLCLLGTLSVQAHFVNLPVNIPNLKVPGYEQSAYYVLPLFGLSSIVTEENLQGLDKHFGKLPESVRPHIPCKIIGGDENGLIAKSLRWKKSSYYVLSHLNLDQAGPARFLYIQAMSNLVTGVCFSNYFKNTSGLRIVACEDPRCSGACSSCKWKKIGISAAAQTLINTGRLKKTFPKATLTQCGKKAFWDAAQNAAGNMVVQSLNGGKIASTLRFDCDDHKCTGVCTKCNASKGIAAGAASVGVYYMLKGGVWVGKSFLKRWGVEID